ncbi:type Iii polyketide Synthase [Mycena pura]|uniref:Type Iii polyketide Synthase n=1 Tax=Mycena pura TaxID=153505 RepID=A0AAD6V8Q3_9AGAR|nr:type Iii polyketide Synthase [Mycena pura]
MSSHSLKITGIGIAYPNNLVPTEDLEKLAYKHHDPSPALDKVLAINRRTGIKTHSLLFPLLELPAPSSIKEVSEIFLKHGVELTISASRRALAEANITPDDITHVVATTCTNSSNPGYDVYLAQALGLRASTEKVLLHGVGCAGGLAALRVASSFCHAAAFRGAPAHVLVVACEIRSSLRRDELACISRDQEVRIAITLFGDGAGALVLSLDPGHPAGVVDGSAAPVLPSRGIFELVNCTHLTVPDSNSDLRVDVDPMGFKPTLSPRIPALTAPCAPPLFSTLLSTLPSWCARPPSTAAPDFDWAVHPGGSSILAGVEDLMALDRTHTQASWAVYEAHGNAGSASVLSVLNTLRQSPGREWVVSMAFGPGIAAEGTLLRRLQ